MQGVEYLYMILGVAFVVPIVIMWRTRMIRLEAHIEVPPEDTAPVVQGGSLPPASWEVSDAVASGGTLVPLRAASLIPVRARSQRPATISDGSPKLVSPAVNDGPLPMPVRRPIEFSGRYDDAAARANGLPVPRRASLTPDSNDES